MHGYRRYAVYAAPPAGSDLACLGADWLGWNPEAGEARAGVEPSHLPRPRADLTAAPRRYGFHGTLKAPFRLAEGAAPEDLAAAMAQLAEERQAFAQPLALASLEGFLALVPQGSPANIDDLAAACVIGLDAFRAEPDAAEIARRDPTRLSAQEAAGLARWGYPYVLETFHFHMTLTGPLPPEEVAPVRAALDRIFASALRQPMPVAEICLFGEDGEGNFHVVRRFALGAGPR